MILAFSSLSFRAFAKTYSYRSFACFVPKAPTRRTSSFIVTRHVSSSDTEKSPELGTDNDKEADNDKDYIPPWNNPNIIERQSIRKQNNINRFRQHVNPLARQFQLQTLLPEDWPKGVFDDCNKPLHLDIGCGKGGFLIDLVNAEADNNGKNTYNYLGLEIRPMVAQYAKERIEVHKMTGRLEYIGCNANVDLERILKRYQKKASSSPDELHLKRVSIQFPDPHFKSRHSKRRVVTAELVDTLAKYMPENSIVFLQSDVKSVLDDMRERFRECTLYFRDELEDVNDYLPENMFGVPTEREMSVLEKDLPVYRTIFTRNNEPHSDSNVYL